MCACPLRILQELTCTHSSRTCSFCTDAHASLQAAKEKSSALVAPETEEAEAEDAPAPSSAPGPPPTTLPAGTAAPADAPAAAAPGPGDATAPELLALALQPKASAANSPMLPPLVALLIEHL